MNNEVRFTVGLPNLVTRRPLSVIVGIAAGLVILISLVLRLLGNIYIGELNWIDAFTPVMIGILMLRGIYSLRRDTDLQAVSIALTGALSFIFVYEAIYKISFYLLPWLLPPSELRDFTIQVGIALTALGGFAFGKFRLTRLSLIFLVLFVILYLFWLLSGFPQVDNTQNVFPAFIHIQYSWNVIYLVNRSTKVMMFLVYFFLYSPVVGMETTEHQKA